MAKLPGHVRPRKNKHGEVTCWEARIPDPRRKTAGGNPFIHTQAFDTEIEADGWLKERQNELYRTGSIQGPAEHLTIKEAGENWLEEVAVEGADKRGPVRASTLRVYGDHLNNYVYKKVPCQNAALCKKGCTGVPDIGLLDVASLSARELERWAIALTREKGRDLAKRVLRDVKGVLALAAKDLTIANKWSDVKLARGRHDDGAVEIVIQTPQASAILDGARQLWDHGYITGADGTIRTLPGEGHLSERLKRSSAGKRRATWARWAPLIWVLFRGGLRSGEALALQFRHIDWKNSRIRVEQTVSDGGKSIEGTKTINGKRWVVLDDDTMAVLQRYRDWCEAPRSKTDPQPRRRTDPDAYVFGSGVGDRWENRSNFRRAWDVLCSMLGLLHPDGGAWASPHDARHWHASFLIESGVPLGDVSRRLGHFSTTITAKIYVHALGDLSNRDREAANAFGAALRERSAAA